MSAPIAFVVVVTDGATLRTLHPAGLGPERAAAIEAIVRAHLFGAAVPALPALAAPAAESLLTQGEIASAQGFTGDVCPQCHAFAMLRSGKCLTCQVCFSTTGCS